MFTYPISSIRHPGVHFFQRLVYPAFVRGRHLFTVINRSLCLYPIKAHANRTWRVSFDSKSYQKVSVIEGHHVYEAIWMPTTGKELSVQSVDDNKQDEHAVAVIKDGLLWGLFGYLHGWKPRYNQVVSLLCRDAIISSSLLHFRQWYFHVYIVPRPRHLLETLCLFHILWAYTRHLLETSVC